MDELAPRVPQTFVDKSMGIVRLGIKRYVLQIQQLINLEVSSENPDLKLIEKCNNVEFKKYPRRYLTAEMHWKNISKFQEPAPNM